MKLSKRFKLAILRYWHRVSGAKQFRVRYSFDKLHPRELYSERMSYKEALPISERYLGKPMWVGDEDVDPDHTQFINSKRQDKCKK